MHSTSLAVVATALATILALLVPCSKPLSFWTKLSLTSTRKTYCCVCFKIYMVCCNVRLFSELVKNKLLQLINSISNLIKLKITCVVLLL